jgi:hypothetical protein
MSKTLKKDFEFTVGCFIFASPNRDGAVAQLVEQWTENPCVGGSTPPHTTQKGHKFVTFFCLGEALPVRSFFRRQPVARHCK